MEITTTMWLPLSVEKILKHTASCSSKQACLLVQSPMARFISDLGRFSIYGCNCSTSLSWCREVRVAMVLIKILLTRCYSSKIKISSFYSLEIPASILTAQLCTPLPYHAKGSQHHPAVLTAAMIKAKW